MKLKLNNIPALLISCAILVGCEKNEVEAPIIPIEDFFRNPQTEIFMLSPNGEFISFLKPYKSRMNIHVVKIGTQDTIRVTNFEDRDIKKYGWASNEKLIFGRDPDGSENYRIYSVNKDGSDLKVILGDGKSTNGVIDFLVEVDDEILVISNEQDNSSFDVYRLNINSGNKKMIAENPGNVVKWITDHEGKLRLALASDGVNNAILYRESEEEDFQTIRTTDFRNEFRPLIFTFDNRNIYMISDQGRNLNALVEYDPRKDEEVKVVFEHHEVDVERALFSRKRKKLTGAVYTTWKTEVHFLDEERKNLQKEVEKLLPKTEVRIVNFSRDEKKCLIATFSDRSMSAYYFYDTNSKELTEIGETAPWLNRENLSEMKPIRFKSRDGLTIHGYLTLPKGTAPKNLPSVVMVHGGPWTRVKWGFDSETQFFANRGYAVLNVNFRASTGYGKEFWQAGFKEWGRNIQNDISDGVKWLIDQEIADPEKVGIYGYSFGGYASLAGMTFTPELYKCGVSYAGISNIFSFLSSIPPYWKPFREMLYEMVGHPENDSLLIYNASPYFHSDSIRAPIFFAEGKKDPRVPVDEIEEIVGALKKRGVPVQYMSKEKEGHGFRNEENRIEFYRKVEKFFARHLGGRNQAKKR